MCKATFGFSALLLITAVGVCQTQTRPTFDVASIRPASPDTRGGGYRFNPGGRMTVTNFTLKNLIQIAWHLQDFEIEGGPAWTASQRYNVEAEAEGNPRIETSRLMLRSLLQERFQLQLRREAVKANIYSLIRDGREGSQLGASTDGACIVSRDPSGFTPQAEPGKAPYCGIKQRLSRQGNGTVLMELSGVGVTLDQLARQLGAVLRKHVENATGMAGQFDFTLNYTPETRLLRSLDTERPLGAQPLETNGPSLFTALEEQLGLKLKSHSGPLEAFVIVHAERPSEN